MKEIINVNFEDYEEYIKESFIKDDKPLIDEISSHFKKIEKQYPKNYKDLLYCFLLKVSGNLKRQEPNIKTVQKELLVCVDKSLNDSLPDILGYYEKEFFEEIINYSNLTELEKLESYIYSLFSELSLSLKDNPYLKGDKNLDMLFNNNSSFYFNFTFKIKNSLEDSSDQERMFIIFLDKLKEHNFAFFKSFIDDMLTEYIKTKQYEMNRKQVDKILKYIPAFNLEKVYDLILKDPQSIIEVVKNFLFFQEKSENDQPKDKDIRLKIYLKKQYDFLDYLKDILWYKEESSFETLEEFRESCNIDESNKKYVFYYLICLYYERLNFSIKKRNNQEQEELAIILNETEEFVASYFFMDDKKLERLIEGDIKHIEEEQKNLLLDCKNQVLLNNNPDIYQKNPIIFIENFNFVKAGFFLGKEYNQKTLIDLYHNIYYKIFDYEDNFFQNSQKAYAIYSDYLHQLLSRNKKLQGIVISEAIQEYYFQKILLDNIFLDTEEEKMLKIFKENIGVEETIQKVINDKELFKELFTVYPDYYLYEEERTIVEKAEKNTYQKLIKRKRESN